MAHKTPQSLPAHLNPPEAGKSILAIFACGAATATAAIIVAYVVIGLRDYYDD